MRRRLSCLRWCSWLLAAGFVWLAPTARAAAEESPPPGPDVAKPEPAPAWAGPVPGSDEPEPEPAWAGPVPGSDEPEPEPASGQVRGAEAALELAGDALAAELSPAPAPPEASSTRSSPAAEPEEPAAVVTGAIVLGLLPYTIAAGAFGVGASAAVSDYSIDSAVGFGPSLAFGATDWLTLGAAVPFASAPVAEERVTGLGNVGLSAQFALFNAPSIGIAFSATPGVTLPSPSPAATAAVTPDLKASGAVNLGALAVNLTARGSVGVATAADVDADPAPAFDTALSMILVNDTIAPFLEGGVSVGDAVVPMTAAGVNVAPGGGTLFTLGVPGAFHQDKVMPGLSFTAYVETNLFSGATATAVQASPAVASR